MTLREKIEQRVAATLDAARHAGSTVSQAATVAVDGVRHSGIAGSVASLAVETADMLVKATADKAATAEHPFEKRLKDVPNAKLYILRYGDFGLHLVGPFDDQEAVCKWAEDPANNPNDDPRWQCIGLVAPELALGIYTPEEATKAMADLMLPELGLRPLDHVF